MIITFEHIYFYRSKECNISINNCRTRDQISADADIHILLSGRKWSYRIRVPKHFWLTSRNSAKHSPFDHMMQVLPYCYLCSHVIAATSAKCLIFITVSYLNTPQAFSCFHYKNSVLPHRWVCDKNCSPPPHFIRNYSNGHYIYVYILLHWDS